MVQKSFFMIGAKMTIKYGSLEKINFNFLSKSLMLIDMKKNCQNYFIKS